MTRNVGEQKPATYGEVLANEQFRVQLGSRSLATLADTLRVVALSVVVYTATHSPALAAIAYGISFLPQLFGAGLFGSLPDRVNPKTLIAGGYLIEAAVGVAVATLPLPVWLDLVLLGAIAFATPVFTSASSSVVAEILEGDAYVLGRSLSSMASSLSQLLGLAGAGVTVTLLGGTHAILCSAIAHLVACAWVWLRMADFAVRRPDPLSASSAIRENWQGILALFRDRPVRILLFAQWLPPALLAGVDALVVPYTGERGLPRGTAGWLMTGVPIGMLIGDFVVGRLVAPIWRERMVPMLVAVMGLPCVVFRANVPWPLLLAALIVVGVGFSYALGVQRRFRDLVPASHRGQAFSLLSTGLMTAQGLCPAVAGLLAEVVHTANAIVILGGLAVATALVLFVVFPATEPGPDPDSAFPAPTSPEPSIKSSI